MIRRTREKVKITFEVILSLFLLTQLSFFAPAEDVWSKVDRIVAVGDVHGDYEQFVRYFARLE